MERQEREDRPIQPHHKQIYDDLKPDEIRVLRLSSGSTLSKEIDCELVITRLSGARDEALPESSQDTERNGRGSDPVVAENQDMARPPPSPPSTTNSSEATAVCGQVEYEAVSWSWGLDKTKTEIRVRKNGIAYDFYVSPHLVDALKALRLRNKDRYLWIDAICINQSNLKERNSQVPKMDRIYGQATNVCIWVGAADEYSDMAIDFISSKLLDIWRFDKLCKDETQSPCWSALLHLMRRDWFSRRWVVQEIALAKRGRLYCGTKDIDWQDFADAVSLFVHVETATHLLTDVMRKDRLLGNMPDYFGDVHALGAALLVDATRNLFRKTSDGTRHSLLSLEYLISKYSVFRASQPRDTIYAFLSIARDTKAQIAQAEMPSAQDPAIREIQTKLENLPHARAILKTWGRRMSAMEEYEVDYASPVEAVYRDFIKFSISKSLKTDPTRPLDILCRPWAPAVRPGDDGAGISYMGPDDEAQFRERNSDPDEMPRPLPSWMPESGRAAFDMIQRPVLGPHMERKNADPLVGLPAVGERTYSAAGTRMLNLAKLRFRSGERYFAMHVEGFILDEVGKMGAVSALGNIPRDWPQFAGWLRKSQPVPEAFWRTLVADRGPNGQNPPTFYSRACEEALQRVWNNEIHLDTKEIINHGHCTIVAEYLRRVQAVIWNRRLMHTKHGNHLGLVPENAKKGDLVCIFYGCSVPVLLRRQEKSQCDIVQGFEQDVEISVNLIKKNWKSRRRLRKLVRATTNLDTTPSKAGGIPNGSASAGGKKVPQGQSTTTGKGCFVKKIPASFIRFAGMVASHLRTSWSYIQSIWLILVFVYGGLCYNIHSNGSLVDFPSWTHVNDQGATVSFLEEQALSNHTCFYLSVCLVAIALLEKLAKHVSDLIWVIIGTSVALPPAENKDEHSA